MSFSNPNFAAEMNIVSQCCRATMVEGIEHDPYPLGRGEYNGSGISYKVEVCENCGEESETVEECGICGELGCRNECEEGNG